MIVRHPAARVSLAAPREECRTPESRRDGSTLRLVFPSASPLFFPALRGSLGAAVEKCYSNILSVIHAAEAARAETRYFFHFDSSFLRPAAARRAVPRASPLRQ